MDDNRTGALFPLPLTPFERYYLTDDRPDYPTTCPLEMRFSGQLQREPFLNALREVIARHPLLAARVADGPNGPQWVPSGQSEPAFDWADESIAIDPPGGEYLDLRVAAGLRTWVRTSADTTRVLMQFHHACCDGLAIFQVAEDLLVLYAAAFAGRDAGLAEPALERLRDRGDVDLTGAPKPSLTIAIRDVWVTAQIWSSVLFRTCAVVAEPTQPRTNTASPSAHPSKTILAFETQVLDRDESRKYAELAAALGVTVNDLLLRDGLVALRQWSQRQGHARLGACRVNVPVYVRGRASGDIPASNGIGFAFVSANPDKIADGGALLGEVHRQMELVKNGKLALYFLGGLAAATKIKPIVPWCSSDLDRSPQPCSVT